MADSSAHRNLPTPAGHRGKVKFIRRRPDGSTDWRFWSQVFWVVITFWIGWEFIRFINFHSSGGTGTPPLRPPGVESFLPISGLMGLRDWWITGVLNHIHPAAAIILLLAIISSVLIKKSFCGWVCPVGFISESVAAVGQKIHRWKGKLPALLDYPLRSIKYWLLAFFVWAIIFKMTPESIRTFIESPYNRVSDIKMLQFFTAMDAMTFWILTGLVVMGFLISGFWCRFLCPYGALVGALSFLAPWKITRRASSCIDCDKCNVACPAHINVAQLTRVHSDECNACLACVQVCPSSQALELALPGSRARLSRHTTLIAVTAVFVIGIGLAMLAGHWQNAITPEEYSRRIQEIDHPKYQHNHGQVPDESGN